MVFLFMLLMVLVSGPNKEDEFKDDGGALISSSSSFDSRPDRLVSS